MLEERHHCSRYYLGAAAPPAVSQALLGGTPRFAPERSFDTLHVRLELDVDLARRRLSGTCALRVKALRGPLRELELQAGGMRLLSARDGAGALRLRHRDGRLTVRLARPLSAGQETEVVLRYVTLGEPAGMHFVSPDPENRGRATQAWSQGQPEEAHYWFPCHDAPHEKATTEIIASVPAGFVAVSNGRLVSRTKKGGKESFHWRMDQPHSLYLVSLAVGRFAEIREKWKDVDVLYYCERGREADARRGFAKTVKAMAFFSEYLGFPYPFSKYAQVAAARFPGGMENTTCTTQTDAVLLTREAALDSDLDTLVSHELAHHWFGDLVTCRDWSHAWLNEGFATYCEYLFTEHDKGRDEADYDLELNRRTYIEEDAHRYRRPVVSNNFRNPWVLFDRHLYEKGGWVLHMLRRELGETDWRRFLPRYLERFRGASVETGDLAAMIEEVTGRNVRPFLDQWVHKAGLPSFEIRYAWDARSRRVELRLRQTQGEPVSAYKVRALLRFRGPGGRWVREFTEMIDKKEQILSFRLPAEPASAEFDPEHDILKKVDFHKPYSLWEEELRSAASGVSRAQAAWAVARWGDARAVRALERAARSDRFWAAASEAARALGSISSDAARQALLRLTSVRHPKVRRSVAQSLGGFPAPEVSRRLLRLLDGDVSIRVRAQAAVSLGRLRDPGSLPALKRALATRTYWDTVACGAVQGLAELREPAAIEALRRAAGPSSTYPARSAAVRALERYATVESRVTGWLLSLLESGDSRVVLSVISTLGSLGDHAAVAPLERLRDRHPDCRVQTYCEEALARIRKEVPPPGGVERRVKRATFK